MDRHLGHIGLVMTIVSAGVLGLSGYLARRRGYPQRVGFATSTPRGPRVSDMFGYSMLALFFIGLAIGTSAPLVPEVDGTVVDLRSGKGNRFNIVVETSRGRYEVIGDPDVYDRCPESAHIVKRAWTTAYACNGSPAGTASIAIFVAIALEALVGVAAIAGGAWRVLVR